MTIPVKILVVDDDPILLKATRHVLENAGYTIITAASGEQGIELTRREHPNLVLLDVNMPGLDGLEALRALKTDPDLQTTFVILMSAVRITSNDQVDGLNIGADGYLARPVSNRELLAHVSAMLRIQTAEAALRQKERQFRFLVEHHSDGILVLDEQGLTLFANAMAGTMFNRTPESLTDQPIGVPLSTAAHADLDLLQPNGSHRWVKMQVTRIEWSGQPAFLAILHDVTEHRLLKEALRTSEEQRIRLEAKLGTLT